jgi:hypothetical protein
VREFTSRIGYSERPLDLGCGSVAVFVFNFQTVPLPKRRHEFIRMLHSYQKTGKFKIPPC